MPRSTSTVIASGDPVARAHRRLLACGAAVCVGLSWLWPAANALAGNGFRPRRPVIWPESRACIELVDRSRDPLLRLAYTFEGDDDVRPADANDELADSRRHQFFGLCRVRPPGAALPNWISAADVHRAALAGLVDQSPAAREIVDDNPGLRGCIWRINGDDDRREITRANAQSGMIWDTRSVPVGTYFVEGYTWEPPTNRWSDGTRPAAVRVVDEPALEASPPSSAFMSGDVLLYRDEHATLTACIVAMPGSTFDVHWAPLDEVLAQGGGLDALVGTALFQASERTVIANQIVPENGRIEFDFYPGADAIADEGLEVALYISVVDPMGRQHGALRGDRVSFLGLDSVEACRDCPALQHLDPDDGSPHDAGGPNCGLAVTRPGRDTHQIWSILAMLLGLGPHSAR